MAIKKVTDIIILDGITEESVKKSSKKAKNDQDNQAITLNCLVNRSRLRTSHLGQITPCIKSSSLTLDAITL